jgi:hypothetical protein
MSSAGPSGVAALPPDWLADIALPLTELAAGTILVRIHRTANPPVFFSPGRARRPAGRFDSAAGAFGVLYLALTLECAFAETVLRNPARRLVGWAEIAARSAARLAAPRPLRFASLHGNGLQTLGLDNAIATGPYQPCGLWADALHAHADRPDGIAYASRFDPTHLCIALFERPDIGLATVGPSTPLIDMLPEVSAVLRRYGKALER